MHICKMRHTLQIDSVYQCALINPPQLIEFIYRYKRQREETKGLGRRNEQKEQVEGRGRGFQVPCLALFIKGH